jgi:DNA replication and repair protein RecF|tara:strand:- start:5141 stop:6256 length:1116 start_codon:yes stop_codon:yes gene_type:complete
MENLLVHALELTHFKNHRSSSWQFNPKVNIISGNNGNGKTNVLDALHYLSLTKSYLNTSDGQNITHGESMSLLKAKLERKSSEHVLDLGLKKGQKKKVRLDGKEIERLADHVGYMPVVMITPMDRDLIIDAAETRRKLMDTTVSQNDKHYLNALMAYNRALTQRNTTLKYFASNRTYDAEMIGLYNEQLALNATIIFEARKAFASELLPLLTHYYQLLSGGKEAVGVRYKSALHDSSMDELLTENEAKDRVLQYTSNGTHRDDLVFHLGEHPIKRVGSQGQQKSFLIALKLAQFEITKRHLGMPPLLLLDDIFDKLDEGRVANLLSLVHTEEFGQIFITDTHPERMLKLSENLKLNHTTFEITDDGEIQSL